MGHAPRVKQPPKPSGATNLRMDFIQIAEGVKNGTLKPAAPPVVPDTWNVTQHRFSHHPLTSPSFGEPVNARQSRSPAYSFGTCSRDDSKNVYIKEVQKMAAGTSPGPSAYGAKGFFGKERPIPTILSTHKKSPHAFMGSDPRDSADRREARAKALQG